MWPSRSAVIIASSRRMTTQPLNLVALEKCSCQPHSVDGSSASSRAMAPVLCFRLPAYHCVLLGLSPATGPIVAPWRPWARTEGSAKVPPARGWRCCSGWVVPLVSPRLPPNRAQPQCASHHPQMALQECPVGRLPPACGSAPVSSTAVAHTLRKSRWMVQGVARTVRVGVHRHLVPYGGDVRVRPRCART